LFARLAHVLFIVLARLECKSDPFEPIECTLRAVQAELVITTVVECGVVGVAGHVEAPELHVLVKSERSVEAGVVQRHLNLLLGAGVRTRRKVGEDSGDSLHVYLRQKV